MREWPSIYRAYRRIFCLRNARLKVVSLFKRNGSDNWWYRKRIPADVQRVLAKLPNHPRPKGWYRTGYIVISTGTPDKTLANLIQAAKHNRSGHRDGTMILVAWRHGLRVSELVDLRSGPDRLPQRHPARPQGQAGHTQHPPDHGR